MQINITAMNARHRNIKPERGRQAGFSLLELTMVIVILAIIGGVAMLLFMHLFQSIDLTKNKAATGNIVFMALREISMDVRRGNKFTFVGETLKCYAVTETVRIYNSGRLVLRAAPGKTDTVANIFITEVDSLRAVFAFASPSDSSGILITVRAKKKQGQPEDFSMTQWAQSRNY